MRSPTLHLPALLLLLLVGGCRQGTSRRVISVIPRDTAEAFWVSEHAGLSEAAAREHVRIYWNGPSGEDDIEQQIVLSEDAIRNGSIGLVLSPNSPFALNTVIHRALEHGIPVVVLGAPVPMPPARGLSFVLNDVHEMGMQAAGRMQEVLHGEGEIAVLGIDPMSPGTVERSDAFEAALKQVAPQIRIIDKIVGPFSFGQAELATERAVQAHPHLSAIFALNVTATRGAVAGVRTTRAGQRIKIIGCDQTLDLLFLLREGSVDSLLVQNMREMGSKAVSTIMEQQKNKRAGTNVVVKPTLVTQKNIDDDAIQHLLMMDWRPR